MKWDWESKPVFVGTYEGSVTLGRGKHTFVTHKLRIANGDRYETSGVVLNKLLSDNLVGREVKIKFTGMHKVCGGSVRVFEVSASLG